ncbi:hypothetical protein [Rothia nasimurium]|uniref:hypothetical protein n=1 Tax=Rothia nasimurium TaxID=85336 RepID=UPI001F446640|nr:hypothetical protein [Rothia nasimurium]
MALAYRRSYLPGAPCWGADVRPGLACACSLGGARGLELLRSLVIPPASALLP